MKDPKDMRKLLNKQQTTLRGILTSSGNFEEGIQLFLKQHASLHSKSILEPGEKETEIWSYPDEIRSGLSENQFRIIPGNSEHSIAWCFWHLARIEDVALNILVSGSEQVFHLEGWKKRLKVTFEDTGNEMNEKSKAVLNKAIEIKSLLEYRTAVGRKTREIVRQLNPRQLGEKVIMERIQHIKKHGILLESAYGIADYWSGRNIAGLLLMPATRHNLVHLNEAYRIKQKIIQ